MSVGVARGGSRACCDEDGFVEAASTLVREMRRDDVCVRAVTRVCFALAGACECHGGQGEPKRASERGRSNMPTTMESVFV